MKERCVSAHSPFFRTDIQDFQLVSPDKNRLTTASSPRARDDEAVVRRV
ncbi:MULTISPECIES: hypothetical protein [Butyricimonas]|nr:MULTISPECIES: hypothetical protein [Butyricimonas]